MPKTQPQKIEDRKKIIKMLDECLCDWFAAEKLLPKKKRNKNELYKYLADCILELLKSEKEKLLERIFKIWGEKNKELEKATGIKIIDLEKLKEEIKRNYENDLL